MYLQPAIKITPTANNVNIFFNYIIIVFPELTLPDIYHIDFI